MSLGENAAKNAVNNLLQRVNGGGAEWLIRNHECLRALNKPLQRHCRMQEKQITCRSCSSAMDKQLLWLHLLFEAHIAHFRAFSCSCNKVFM